MFSCLIGATKEIPANFALKNRHSSMETQSCSARTHQLRPFVQPKRVETQPSTSREKGLLSIYALTGNRDQNKRARRGDRTDVRRQRTFAQGLGRDVVEPLKPPSDAGLSASLQGRPRQNRPKPRSIPI